VRPVAAVPADDVLDRIEPFLGLGRVDVLTIENRAYRSSVILIGHETEGTTAGRAILLKSTQRSATAS